LNSVVLTNSVINDLLRLSPNQPDAAQIQFMIQSIEKGIPLL